MKFLPATLALVLLFAATFAVLVPRPAAADPSCPAEVEVPGGCPSALELVTETVNEVLESLPCLPEPVALPCDEESQNPFCLSVISTPFDDGCDNMCDPQDTDCICPHLTVVNCPPPCEESCEPDCDLDDVICTCERADAENCNPPCEDLNLAAVIQCVLEPIGPCQSPPDDVEINVPSGVHDNDGDSFYRVESNHYTVTFNCSTGVPIPAVSPSGPGIEIEGAEPDDNDPCNPNPVLCSGAPGCPAEGQSFPGPSGVPSAQDQDGDGFPVLVLHMGTYEIEESNQGLCTLAFTPSSGPGTPIDFPDPDDDDPCVPSSASCGPCYGMGNTCQPPDCPVLGPYSVPASAPHAEDRDHDGAVAIYLQSTTYTINGACQLQTTTGTEETPISFPDPDDNDPCLPVPCGIVPSGFCQGIAGTSIPLRSGYATKDEDQDGFSLIGVTETTYNVTADCGYTTHDTNQTMWTGFADPDDEDPCNPKSCDSGPVEGVCGAQPSPCIILVQTVPGACGQIDGDGDHVPAIYKCDTTLTCWSDAHCDSSKGPVAGQYGDGDDGDPCNPIDEPRVSPNCRTLGNGTTAKKQSEYGADASTKTWRDWLDADTNWLWLLLVVLAIYWYYKHKKDRRQKRMNRRQGYP